MLSPPTRTLRGGGFVPFARAQDVHTPTTPFDRGYFCPGPVRLTGGHCFLLVGSHPVMPAALRKDVVMPHGLYRPVQVSIVHAFREDAPVILAADVRGAVDVGVQHLPVVLPVQAPLYAPAGENSLFRVRGPVHRHAVTVPEAGPGRIALFLQDDADAVPAGYCRQYTAEPVEWYLHEGLVGLPAEADVLLLAPVVPGYDEGYVPCPCQAADIVGVLVEGVPQEGVTPPRQLPHLPCYRRVVCLWVMALHLPRFKEGHPFIVPLVPCLYRPALDNDGDAAFVVCLLSKECCVSEAILNAYYTAIKPPFALSPRLMPSEFN